MKDPAQWPHYVHQDFQQASNENELASVSILSLFIHVSLEVKVQK